MIALIARHPTAGNLMMLALILVGVIGFTSVRRESLPALEPVRVEVTVAYPGASTAEVEEAICRPLEKALEGILYLEELTSESKEGRGVVTCEMIAGHDFERFTSDIQTKLDALDNLPEDSEEPIVERLGLEENVLALIVTGPGSVQALRAYCLELEDRLRELEQVSLVEVEGFGDRQLRVELKPEALARYGLGPLDVAKVISAQSIDQPAGSIDAFDRQLLIRFVERRRTPSEIEDLVIVAGDSGTEVRLREFGRVVDLFDDPELRIEFDGKRAAKLTIQKTRSEDSLSITDEVRAFVERERAEVSPGVQLYLTEDSSETVRGQIELVSSNALQGMLLVALVLWLFFTPRLAFWVVMGLPVSVMGASAFLPALGLTINMLTLVGYLLALGLLMDDAIVIAENIARHRESGKPAMQAAIDGTREVIMGVFGSFLTTICVLGPLVLLEGNIGQLLRVVPMILILVLGVSLIEAFWILPGHLGHALGHSAKPSRFRLAFERLVETTRERLVGRCADFCIAHRYPFLGSVLGTMLLAVGLLASGRVPFEAMPELEGDVIVARVLMPQGTPLWRTEEVVAQLYAGLEETDAQWSQLQPDGEPLVLGSYVQFGKNIEAFESGAHVATVAVDLRTAQDRSGRVDDYLRDWRRHSGQIAGATEVLFATPNKGAAGRAIEIRVSGDELEELRDVANQLKAAFERYRGTKNLSVDLRPGKLEVELAVIEGARGLGFDAQTIAAQVSAGFQGRAADELQIGSETVEVDVRMGLEGRDSLTDLESMQVPMQGGGRVNLSAITQSSLGRGWARIARVDGRRTVTLRGDIDKNQGNTAAILAKVQAEELPAILEAHPGVEVTLDGEATESAKSQASMLRNMLIGLIGVFALLSFQFKSYSEPLVVMAAIPLSLIGVLGGHYLMGFPFTLPSMLGFISLAGVVVNDSILLLEFLKQEAASGKSPALAASAASRARFRAVFLTSSTTIAGLLPLLFEGSLQAMIVKGLVISVAFGLMASTLLVLFVVPSMYMVLADLGWLKRPEPSR